MKTELKDIFRLLKAAKESELEAIEQLMKKYDSEGEGEAGGETAKTVQKSEKGEKAASGKGDVENYEDMTAAQLYKLCGQRGLSGKCKDRKKDTLIALLREADAPESKQSAKKETKKGEKPVDDWGEEEESKKDYENMTARQLYDECISRKIECEKRKKPEYYIALLKEADESSDWGEEDGGGSGDSDEDWELD